MRFPKSAVVVGLLGLLAHHAAAHTDQLPLSRPTAISSWNTPPVADESGHLIFNSASSYLQHWPNTRYRNGHSIVLGYVKPGMLLYHGERTNWTPTGPDWLAFDFEYSFVFGSFMRTYTVSGPGKGLKVLYLDGSSASNMPSGTIDTQLLLIHGKIIKKGWMDELNNIRYLCDWAQKYDIRGFVRMEYDFELMLCDFTNGVKTVSDLPFVPTMNDKHRKIAARHPRLLTNKGFPPPLPDPPLGWKGSLRPYGSAAFQAIQAGNWHNAAPGVSGIELDYSSAISFFDPRYTSLVTARRQIDKREAYRTGNISRSDMEMVFTDLDEVLRRDPGAIGSGIQWAGVMRSVKDRHSGRLEYLAFTLRQNVTVTHSINTTVSRVRDQLLTILSPFLLNAPIPSSSFERAKWMVVPIHLCTNTFTSHIYKEYLTPQEKLIKHGIEVVMQEICRTMGALWLDAFEAEEASVLEQRTLVDRWRVDVETLMTWLGWAEWIKCEPACKPTEMCLLPQWPFDMGNFGAGGRLPPEEREKALNDYKPRCMDRLAEYLA